MGEGRGLPSKFLAIKPVSGPAPHLHVLVTWQSYVCYTRLSHYRSHSFQKADLKCSVQYNKCSYLWIPRFPTGCESLNFRTLASCQMAVMWCRRGLCCILVYHEILPSVGCDAMIWCFFVKYWPASIKFFTVQLSAFRLSLKMPGYIHHLQMCVSDLGRLQQIFNFIE